MLLYLFCCVVDGQPCPNDDDNTFSHGPYCYTFVENKTTWSDSSNNCQHMYTKGNLVSITSLDEQEFLTNSLKTINDSSLKARAWIGLHDQEAEGAFHWTDHSPVNFIYWHKDEPNNYRAAEDCVELRGTTGWNDLTCSQNLPYICKYPRRKIRLFVCMYCIVLRLIML